jgi:hypothetical protein
MTNPAAAPAATPTRSPTGDPPLSQLFDQLADQTRRLVRAEMALAKAELTHKAKLSAVGIALCAAAGVIVADAIGVLMWSAILGLGETWPLWLSALVIGVGMIVVAGGMVFGGVKLLKKMSTPPQSIERVLADVAAVRSRLSGSSGLSDEQRPPSTPTSAAPAPSTPTSATSASSTPTSAAPTSSAQAPSAPTTPGKDVR